MIVVPMRNVDLLIFFEAEFPDLCCRFEFTAGIKMVAFAHYGLGGPGTLTHIPNDSGAQWQ